LRLISVVGAAVSALSFVTLVVLALRWFAYGVPFAGFGTLVGFILLLFGILFSMIGIVSEYVGLIYEEVKQRPNFIVRTALGINLDANSQAKLSSS
jgi:dolichol-phosphate mannosyltransferase